MSICTLGTHASILSKLGPFGDSLKRVTLEKKSYLTIAYLKADVHLLQGTDEMHRIVCWKHLVQILPTFFYRGMLEPRICMSVCLHLHRDSKQFVYLVQCKLHINLLQNVSFLGEMHPN